MAENPVETLKTLIVDDEPLAVERMQVICAKIPAIQVVGTASDGGQALRLVDKHGIVLAPCRQGQLHEAELGIVAALAQELGIDGHVIAVGRAGAEFRQRLCRGDGGDPRTGFFLGHSASSPPVRHGI